MFKLKELRNEYGISRADLSRALNINQGTLANYENEIRQADYKTLAIIAGFFDVTIDYLIGQTVDSNDTAIAFKPLSIKEKNLIAMYRKLSNKSKEIIHDTIDHLSDLEVIKTDK